MELFEGLELLGYLFGFWLFIFSRGFREEVIRGWRERPWVTKLFIPIEVAASTFCGLMPIALVAWTIERCSQ